MQRKFSEARKTIMRLKNELYKIRKEISCTSEKNLEEILNRSNISKGQCELVKEIFIAAKLEN